MTDTNNKKETFESEFAIREQAILMTIEKNLNIKDKRAREANNFLSNMRNTLFKFKQLHDKEIQELQTEVERFYEGLIWMKKNQYKKK